MTKSIEVSFQYTSCTAVQNLLTFEPVTRDCAIYMHCALNCDSLRNPVITCGGVNIANVPFFSRTVIIKVKVVQNLHDRVIAMSGRADRRNIRHWYEAKLYFVTYVTRNITELNSISVHYTTY
jgi:hypothetical protein